MPIDYAKVRNWSRKGHTEDDPALGIAWEAAKRELEMRTGWCVDPVTRTQYVAAAPDNSELLLRLERQPATAAQGLVNDEIVSLTLVTINGIQYAKMDADMVYPLSLTVTAGTNTLNPLLEMALLQRTVQLEASRGDDMTTLPGDYWDRICRMLGKGIG